MADLRIPGIVGRRVRFGPNTAESTHAVVDGWFWDDTEPVPMIKLVVHDDSGKFYTTELFGCTVET